MCEGYTSIVFEAGRKLLLLALVGLVFAIGCGKAGGGGDADGGVDGDADGDTDTDGDADADGDSDSDSDTDPTEYLDLVCDDDAGTCVDPNSGLVWQEPPTFDIYGWNAAIATCDALVLDGQEDWRMPTTVELRTLTRGCPPTEYGGDCPLGVSCFGLDCWEDSCNGCDMGEGPGTDGCYYDPQLAGGCDITWTADTREDDTDWALIIHFDGGGGLGFQHKGATTPVTRCVRGEL